MYDIEVLFGASHRGPTKISMTVKETTKHTLPSWTHFLYLRHLASSFGRAIHAVTCQKQQNLNEWKH